jgi:RimJ/RimL family protein N-acetyltransferase
MDCALHAASIADLRGLLELLSIPAVYEFLADGVPPGSEIVEDWIWTAVDGQPPYGLWLLETAGDSAAGCVRLSQVTDEVATAELTYVLHPAKWGSGLATAMSRSALSQAFELASCDSILAGADVANRRSVAVMERLGMRRLREVAYPAGPGVEYIMSRTDFASMPRGATIPFA